MTQRSRDFLFNGPFSNGKRPDENDFNDVWESFLNFQDDPISIDGDNNCVFGQGIQISNSTGEVDGTIRFEGGVFQFRESGNWVELGSAVGSGGAFQEVGGGPNVAFNGGTVAIGSNSASNYMLDVRIGLNTGNENQVRFGSAVIHDRSLGSADRAHFSHESAANDTDFALRQRSNGAVTLNAPLDQRIEFKHADSNTRMRIERNTGNVIIGGSVSTTVQNNNTSAPLFVDGEIVMAKSPSNTKNIWEILDDFETRISNLEP